MQKKAEENIIPSASYYIAHKNQWCEYYRGGRFKLLQTTECENHASIAEQIQPSIAVVTFHNQEHEIIETESVPHSPRTDIHQNTKNKLDPKTKPKVKKIVINKDKNTRVIEFYDDKNHHLGSFEQMPETDSLQYYEKYFDLSELEILEKKK
jgi:hypothetical protein